MLHQELDPVVIPPNDLADGFEHAADAPLGHFEQDALGLVDHLIDLFPFLVGQSSNLAGGGNQAAHSGGALNNVRIVLDVHRRGHHGDQGRQIGRSADRVQRALPGEFVHDGNKVRRLAPLMKGRNGPVDGPVGVAVKVIRLQKRTHLDDRIGVDQQAA